MGLFKSKFKSSKPWLMEPSAFREMLTTAKEQQIDIKAAADLWSGSSEECDDTINSVRVISINGVLMRQASWWSWLYDESAYEQIEHEIVEAIEDANVKAIILAIDSPGGEVTGVADLAKTIRQYSEIKPIIAYGTGSICSAAYWIASACSEIVVSDTSVVGSIGCVMEWTDYSKMYEAAGIKDYQIVSSQSPFKRVDPATEAGMATLQDQVDKLAQIFIEAVANFRDETTEKIMSDYGKGGVLIGLDAVNAGLADAVGSIEDIINEYGSSDEVVLESFGENDMLKRIAALQGTKVKAEDTLDPNKEVDPMSNEMDPEDQNQTCQNEDGDGTDPENGADPEEDKTIPANASAEQKRIAAILYSAEANGRGALARHFALKTSMSAKDAIAALKASPKATATAQKSKPAASEAAGWDEAMRAQGNPAVGSVATPNKSMSEDDKAAELLLSVGRKFGIIK